jgi:hypothetical protein
MHQVPSSFKGKVRFALSIAFLVLAILTLLSCATVSLALVGLAPSDFYDTDAFLALYTLPTWLAWLQTGVLTLFAISYASLSYSLWKRSKHTWLVALLLAILQVASIVITITSGDGIPVLEVTWVIGSMLLAGYTRQWRHLPV